MGKSKKFVALAVSVVLIVGASIFYYVHQNIEDVPTVTVDGKEIPLVVDRYNGKYDEKLPLDELIQEKGFKPVVVSNHSTFNVKFSGLDELSNYRIIEGSDHGWMMEFVTNGKTLDARSNTGVGDKMDDMCLVKVSKYLNYGDKVYEFVLKTKTD